MNEAPSAVFMSETSESGMLVPEGVEMRICRIASRLWRYWGQPSHDQIEATVTFENLGHGLAADRRLHHGPYVADVDSITRTRGPVRFDQQVGLTQRPVYRGVLDPRNGLEHSHDATGEVLVGPQIRAEDLDRISRLHPGQRLVHIVLDVLRVTETDARQRVAKLFVDPAYEFCLAEMRGPLVERLEVDEELGIEKSGRIGTVVRATDLGQHERHLGEGQENPPSLLRNRGGPIQRNAERHSGARPDVALFKLRQKLASE